MAKIMKKILTAVLSLAMVACFVPQMGTPVYADEGTPAIQLVAGGSAVNIQGAQASSVWFGNYMQSSADTKDPVKWRVLQNADGKLFLLSDQNLDCKKYNESDTSVTWGTSTIRTWLNGDFKNAAFSTKEADAVVETEVVNTENPEYHTPGGNTTTDEVFLLSIGEATNTAYGFTDNYSSTNTRVATNTAYVAGYSGMNESGQSDLWWLRSPGDNEIPAAIVYDSGDVDDSGYFVDDSSIAVRPAFNLNLESVLFTSAAEGGKSSGAEGALNEVGTTSGNEWKVTLKDTDRGFAVTGSKAAEDGVTVEYKDAESGDDEYISAVIKDNEGKIKYYGRLAKVSDAGTSGSVTINAAGKLEAGDTLYVFNEQYNGDKKTDYASALQEVAVPSAAIQLVTNGAAPNIKGAQKSSVWFGNYMQNSADTKEPVKWRVLQNADGKLLLLSDQNLDCKKYNEEYKPVTWETSSIREWLNDSFLNNTFSAKEETAVAKTLVRNKKTDSYTPNPYFPDMDGGNDTEDNVFLLSIAEATNEAYGFTSDYSSTNTRVALNTEYANNHGAYTYSNGAGYWWLRSFGISDGSAAVVYNYGSVGLYGDYVDVDSTAVRPAFNLNLESVLFTSAAEGGKSSGAEGAGSLERVGSNSNGEWKLTLESGHDSFKVEDVSTCDGKTVNIKYSGAVAKKGEYISAIIADENDEVKYYGNLIEFADGDSTQGTAKVTIDGKMGSTDKLYVFNEQMNGDKKTDFSSTLQEITIPTELHDWKAATCTEPKTCKDCGVTDGNPLGHKWDAGKVTKKATEKQAGVKTYTCTVCKATKTETIPKLKPQPKPQPQPIIDKASAKIALDAGVVARSSGSKVTASWGAVKGASSYVIYANYCDKKTCKKIRTVSGKTTSINITKLNGKKFNPKKNLKFYVVAYKTVKGKKVKLTKSIMAHAPGSKNSKRTNVTGVKVKKASFTLKKGKTAKIKARLVLQKKSKKPLKHCAKFRYASSNKKVAKVSKKGKITAVGKGKCTVYVYAVSGVSKKIKVTVK